MVLKSMAESDWSMSTLPRSSANVPVESSPGQPPYVVDSDDHIGLCTSSGLDPRTGRHDGRTEPRGAGLAAQPDPT